MFVELHILQNFPPSNLNRDDVGQPKETDFGGVRRARISSQCLKRAVRYAGKDANDKASRSVFEQHTGVKLGQRTKLIANELTLRLKAMGKPEDAASSVAETFAEAYAGKMDEKRKGETAVLLFLSTGELDWVAGRLNEHWDAVSQPAKVAPSSDAARPTKGKKAKADKAESSAINDLVTSLIKETDKRTSAPDIALFGRMLADKPKTNIDAACQVAHAISTHAVPKAEIDYYTAVDELKPKEESGAGYLDVAYFNSACFYRYARIDVAQLMRNLNGDAELARKSVEAFIRASEAAIPSSKKNSHAQETRPGLVLAVVRTDNSQGWSLANAFENPIRATSEASLTEASTRELCAEFDDHLERYGAKTVVATSVFTNRHAKSAVHGTLESAIAQANGDDSALDTLVKTVTDALHKGA
jgi:CRISPR system Cascade subunit CasC